MIYGFSLLFLLTGVMIGIQAGLKFRFMQKIRKNGKITTGIVLSSKSALGWLWTYSFGNQDRPRISYQAPRGKEMILEVVTSSILPRRRYEPGQTVGVVFDPTSPGNAYLKQEWIINLRELWFSGICIFLSILIWVIGRVNNLPF